jgi:hypothetical protein
MKQEKLKELINKKLHTGYCRSQLAQGVYYKTTGKQAPNTSQLTMPDAQAVFEIYINKDEFQDLDFDSPSQFNMYVQTFADTIFDLVTDSRGKNFSPKELDELLRKEARNRRGIGMGSTKISSGVQEDQRVLNLCKELRKKLGMAIGIEAL